jgi:hypothetical protein
MNMLLPFLLEADTRKIDAAGEQAGVEALGLLGALALVTVEPDGRVRPRPVAARFAPVVAVADADDGGEQQSLL